MDHGSVFFRVIGRDRLPLSAAGNVSVLCVVVVTGVTQLHDVVYMTYEKASALYVKHASSNIWRFDAATHEELREIHVDNLRAPLDIAACGRTSQLYIAEWNCVWRMSPDGRDTQHWLPKSPDDTFKPFTLSVTSTRLLVTSYPVSYTHLTLPTNREV